MIRNPARWAIAPLLALAVGTAAHAAQPFPLGTYVGNPNGNDPAAEAAFEAAYNAHTAKMGQPAFMNAFVDQSQTVDQWSGNAGWTAWSWASSPVVGHTLTPVVGIPMADNAHWSNGQFFADVAAGKYDAAFTGIVDAWVGQGYSRLVLRLGYEMNGSYMPSFPSDADGQKAWVAEFQHLSMILRAEAIKDRATVSIVWNPTLMNWTPFDVASLYPGDAYVDVIGIDTYNPLYPLDLTDWSDPARPQAPDFTTWAAKSQNRDHFWLSPSANQWNPAGQKGTGWSLGDTIKLAKAHNKPLAIPEAGAGLAQDGDGTAHSVSDDPAFPAWLARTLTGAGVPVAFVNVWDACLSDGCWQYTGTKDRPSEAAAWAKNFNPQ